jgi:hypothetical protein
MSIITSPNKSYKLDAIAAEEVVIRRARSDDRGELDRLAARDSAALPDGTLLVAEAGGQILAALPVAGGRAIADPFRRTADLAALLELRAGQMRAEARRASARVVARSARAPRLATAPGR